VSAPDQQRSARAELREQLLQAARRDDAQRTAELPARRRRSRRSLAVVAALIFGAAAAAGAAELISTGEPVPHSTYSGTKYQPGKAGAPALAAKAANPAGGQAWGVGIYRAKSGDECVIAGQVRGVSVGEVRGGTFHPFEQGSIGICGDFKRLKLIYDVKRINGLTVVYGRTREAGREVTVDNDGETIPARPGRGGAFRWVFKGTLLPGRVVVRLGARIPR
jgi:hypothetical protein